VREPGFTLGGCALILASLLLLAEAVAQVFGQHLPYVRGVLVVVFALILGGGFTVLRSIPKP
jgi:hypothetical protein